MTLVQVITIFVLITLILVEICAAATYIIRRVLIPYKLYTADLSMPELLTALNAIIENQISLYNKSIFEGGKRKIASNAQFENYYRDLCDRILNDLSPEFFERMSFFMKKEAVVAMVCRIVKEYLSENVISV